MATYPTIGSIESLDPAFDQLVLPDARLEILTEGFEWTEGPVWIPEGGYLLFSDIPPNNIYKWKEGEGRSLFLNPSGYTGTKERGGEVGSNGLTLDPEGRLVLCQHGDRQMARLDSPLDSPKPNYITLADRYGGKRLNSPNDCVFKSNGDLYFTDPPYGLEGNIDDPEKELDFQGVFRLSADGELTLLTDELSRPNGLAFSPDERILYVSNSDPKQAVWMAYDLNDDGTISSGQVFFDATEFIPDRTGLPDGFKLDRNGNLFATGPGGVFVFDPSGKHLGLFDTTQPTSNCAWGDDGSTLYISANMYLLRIRLNTIGNGW